MQIKSGVFSFSKKEMGEMLCVLEHVERDISYGAGGTFSKHDESADTKEIEKAKRGIELIKWVIESYE